MFLYILSMPQYKAIKIGIAKNYSRIKQHMETYGEIDLEGSYIVHAKNTETIKILEKQLLEDYIEYKINNKEIINKDGYTEFRKNKILNDVLEDIEFKANKFTNKNIKIIKGVNLPNDKKEKQIIGVGKNKYLYKDNKEIIPNFLLEFPMFNYNDTDIVKNLFNIEDYKIETINDNGEFLDMYDYITLIKIINIYLKNKVIQDIKELKRDDNTFIVSCKEIIEFLNMSTGGKSFIILQKRLEKLSKTTINIYKNNNLIHKLENLISFQKNEKKRGVSIEINSLLLNDIRDGNFINCKELNNMKSIKSKLSIRLYHVLIYLKGRKKSITVKYEDIYNYIPLKKTKSYSKRKLIYLLDELVENELISAYNEYRNCIEIIY